MNEPKVAILYTGEVRTIESAIPYFKENVLINENRHVFAVLQTDNIPYFDAIVKTTIERHLKSIEWFDKTNETWSNVKEAILHRIEINDLWKDYLRTSGSIIEYYQMYLAYQKMVEYENENGIKYDYVMRIRGDVVLTHPIHFEWDLYSIDDIHVALHKIKDYYEYNTIISKDVVCRYMNSFYHPSRILQEPGSSKIHFDDYPLSDDFTALFGLTGEIQFMNEFYKYFINGKYMITLRKNQIYFIKRRYFDDIASLGVTYGKRAMMSKARWFDAETQFQSICVENDIDIFDSTTEMEGKSLYSYNHANYFDDEGNLIKTPDCLFFIKRV